MLNRNRKTEEGGFTLVELLVVILVIGILTAIAVPVFLNQRKKAGEASVQSDLKNAATAMETESVANGGKFLSYLPNYENRSEGVSVTLRKDKSNANQFCLEGRIETQPGLALHYSSQDGGLLEKGKTCADVTAGNNYAVGLEDKKVLVIENQRDSQIGINALRSYGFGTVDIRPATTLEELEGYDVIAAFGDAWALNWETEQFLKKAYEAGFKIITDGNDIGKNTRSWMFAESANMKEEAARNIRYIKTGASGLTPAFPYTFNEVAFKNDTSWTCITALSPGSVPVATSPVSDGTDTQCITAAAASNSKGGRFLHITKYNSDGTNILDSGLDWMLM